MKKEQRLILLKEKDYDLLRNLLADYYCYSESINLAKKIFNQNAIWKEPIYDDGKVKEVAENITNNNINFDEFGDEFDRAIRILKDALKKDSNNKILNQLGELLTGDCEWLKEVEEE